MRWTDRQRAMLLEMGIRLWPDAPSKGPSEAAQTHLEVKPAVQPRTRPRKAVLTRMWSMRKPWFLRKARLR